MGTSRKCVIHYKRLYFRQAVFTVGHVKFENGDASMPQAHNKDIQNKSSKIQLTHWWACIYILKHERYMPLFQGFKCKY